MFYYKTIEDETGLWLTENQYRREYLSKTESVFAQCNGHFGVRASHELNGITQTRGMFVSGLYQKADPGEVTELVNCPDVCAAEIYADGARLSLDSAEISDYNRKLQVSTGELRISCNLKLDSGLKLRLESRRFASRADLHLFCHEMTFYLLEGQKANLDITYGIDGQITNSGASHFQKIECRVYDREYMSYQGMLNDNGLELLLGGILTGGQETAKHSFQLKRRSIYKRQMVRLEQNGPVRLLRVSHIRERSDHLEEAPEDRAMIIKQAAASGYDVLFREHCEITNKFWDMAGIGIDGASLEERAALCFAQYHIYGMVPDYTDRYSIAAKGLTGEGYKGHVFWDTEIFLLPFFYYEFPETARKLLQFRYHGIEGARAKAEEYGYRGAMFPWETAKTGYEETPLYAALNIHTGKANKVWSGIKEHHVTADIVYAVMKYVSITDDWDFVEKYGADLVFHAADFWVSRAQEHGGRLEITDIIGPDEYNEHIDNNTYTNYLAGFTVESAVLLEGRLRKRGSRYFANAEGGTDWSRRMEEWQYFVDHIYLAEPGRDRIIPQDDTFLQKEMLPDIEKYRRSLIKQSVLLDYSRDEVVDMQVLKQADLVMLLNLFPGRFDPETVKENVLFYEARTLHDSSLSYCAHAQACAAIGEAGMAWSFFEKAMEVDLSDNPCDSTDGIHAASLGGIWNCIIQGFAGVAHDWNGLSCSPHLPEHWEKISFRFRYQGNCIHAQITQNTVRLEAEKAFAVPVPVRIRDQKYELAQCLEVNY